MIFRLECALLYFSPSIHPSYRIIEVGSEYSKSHILDLIDQLSDSHVKETAVQKMLVYICEEVCCKMNRALGRGKKYTRMSN